MAVIYSNPEEMKYHLQIKKEYDDSRRRRKSLWHAVRRRINYFAGGNILDIWMKSIHGTETRGAEAACKQADVVLRCIGVGGKWHDFGNPGKYIALGRRVAEEQIDSIRALVREATP